MKRFKRRVLLRGVGAAIGLQISTQLVPACSPSPSSKQSLEEKIKNESIEENFYDVIYPFKEPLAPIETFAWEFTKHDPIEYMKFVRWKEGIKWEYSLVELINQPWDFNSWSSFFKRNTELGKVMPYVRLEDISKYQQSMTYNQTYVDAKPRYFQQGPKRELLPLDNDPDMSDSMAERINNAYRVQRKKDTSTPRVEKYNVTVKSTVPWTSTGIKVGPKDTISIEASGSVIYADPDDEHTTGPNGTSNTSGVCSLVVTHPDVRAQSLVGNIATSPTLDGKGFQVGERLRDVVVSELYGQNRITSNSGTLYLGFNDSAVKCDRSNYDRWGFGGDNHGSFNARITIKRG